MARGGESSVPMFREPTAKAQGEAPADPAPEELFGQTQLFDEDSNLGQHSEILFPVRE